MIRLTINGRTGQWRNVSEGFYKRLREYAIAKPWRDIVIETR